jgi:two-component system, LuxR family, sensor kinase FixL
MADVKALQKKLKRLRDRLADTEQTLEAIRNGKVDALMVQTQQGEQVFTLRGADHPYRVMVEQMAEGAVTFDRDGTILFCNQRFAELLHVPMEQIMGSQLFTYLSPAEQGSFQDVLGSVNGIAGRTEVRLLTSDGGTFPASVSVTALALDESSVVYSMVVNNLEQQRRLERQVLEVSEREQQRLGQDLHDGLGQALAGITYMLQSIEPKTKHLERATELLSHALFQTRELAKGFYPVELERHGLQRALQELAAHVNSTFKVNCDVVADKYVSTIDKSIQIHLFRIVQESIRNAVRHGKARAIRIHAARAGNEVTIVIQNDGLLFPTKKMQLTINNSHGMGLKIMHYRARIIGATLEMAPGRKSGCVVRCTIPFQKHARR